MNVHPESRRIVVRLLREAGYSISDIARMLDLPETLVRKDLLR